jgi:transcriptional regulator GlxA family with amidase domain
MLARLCNTTPRSLESWFQSHLGCTVKQWLSRCQMEYAGLLLDVGTPLEEVANAAGFSSKAHFARAYKSKVGVHPARNSPMRKSDPRNDVSFRHALEVPVLPVNPCVARVIGL